MPKFSHEELSKWSEGEWVDITPDLVNGVTHDTRTLSEGNIYIALKGESFDGHDFVCEAFERGASSAIVCRDYKPSGISPQSSALLRVEDTKKALADIAVGYRKKVDPEVVAVTGSAGKSTVKEMTARMLGEAMPVACTKGNWNNDIGVPLSMLAMEANSKVGVFEIGMNHPGEISELCGLLEPSWGVITNIGPAHIEFFDSVEAIAREKRALLESMPSHGTAVLNKDDAYYGLLNEMAPSNLVTVSVAGDADYTGNAGAEIVINEQATGEKVSLNIESPGEHVVMNVLFATAVARGHGVSWEQITQAMNGFKALPQRWEQSVIKGVKVIDDTYNANPLSMKASILAFSEMEGDGGKWLVLGGMLELGEKEKKEHMGLGEYVAAGDWRGLIAVGQRGVLIADGARRAGMDRSRVIHCDNKDSAAEVIKEKLFEGDRVLLKASRGEHLEDIVNMLRHSEKE